MTKLDTILFTTHQNLIPTNTPGNNASVTGTDSTSATIFSGSTDSNGDYQTSFVSSYIANPCNIVNKIYTPSSITVDVTRINTQDASKKFYINGADITWNNDLQQTLISKNGTANGKVTDESSNPINGASAKVYDNSNNLFGQDNTNISGDYQINYTYPGYENDAPDTYTPTDSLKFIFNATGKNEVSLKKKFANPITVNATMTSATSLDTLVFTTHQT